MPVVLMTADPRIETATDAVDLGALQYLVKPVPMDVLRTAVEALAPRGELGIIGAPEFGVDVSLEVQSILSVGRVIRGIVEGDAVSELFLPTLIDLWRRGRFPVDRMMVTYDFDRINEAADDAETGATIKPVLVM